MPHSFVIFSGVMLLLLFFSLDRGKLPGCLEEAAPFRRVILAAFPFFSHSSSSFFLDFSRGSFCEHPRDSFFSSLLVPIVWRILLA